MQASPLHGTNSNRGLLHQNVNILKTNPGKIEYDRAIS